MQHCRLHKLFFVLVQVWRKPELVETLHNAMQHTKHSACIHSHFKSFPLSLHQVQEENQSWTDQHQHNIALKKHTLVTLSHFKRYFSLSCNQVQEENHAGLEGITLALKKHTTHAQHPHKLFFVLIKCKKKPELEGNNRWWWCIRKGLEFSRVYAKIQGDYTTWMLKCVLLLK